MCVLSVLVFCGCVCASGGAAAATAASAALGFDSGGVQAFPSSFIFLFVHQLLWWLSTRKFWAGNPGYVERY